MGPGGGRLLATFGAPNYFDIPMEAPTGSLVKLGATFGGGFKINSVGVSRGAPLSTATVVAASPTRTRPAVVRNATALPAGQRGEDTAWLAALERLTNGGTRSVVRAGSHVIGSFV